MSDTKQPEALRLARELEGVYPVNIQDQEAAAAELRRLHALNTELLVAVKQLGMWLPLTTEMAGLDYGGTTVEFSEFINDPDRVPETISISGSLALARAAIAKATGEQA